MAESKRNPLLELIIASQLRAWANYFRLRDTNRTGADDRLATALTVACDAIEAYIREISDEQ